MPKINVYLPEALADAVRDAQLPVSAICQAALERAVRDVTSARGASSPPPPEDRGPGLFSRFTVRARRALELAEATARSVPHDHVGTEHVLVGLIDEGGNLALKVLETLEIEPADLRVEVVAALPPRCAGAPAGHLPFAPETKRVLELTAKEALTLGHNYIGCEHVLLGLLAADGTPASQLLGRMGLELRTTRRAVQAALVGFVYAQPTASATPPPVPPTPTAPRTDEGTALADVVRRLEALEARLGGTPPIRPT